jgi:energy-coupling factor transporter ATP-binding protein EcfA2
VTAAPFQGLEPGAELVVPAHPTLGPPETIYTYRDANGEPLFAVCRFRAEEDGRVGKTFRQGHPAVGGWSWSLNGVESLLYRFDEVSAWLEGGAHGVLYNVEGERDCDRLRAYLREHADDLGPRGLLGPVTTNPMGAGKWRPEYGELLRGARCVIVIADNDEPGRTHARAIAADLRPYVDKLEIRRTPLDEKGADLSDHLDAGLGLDALVALELETEPTANEPRPFAIEVHTTRELAAIADPSGADELLGPILVRGQRTVIGGHTGEGKTTLALALAAAVAFRSEFLGWQARRGKVLVIDAEQGLRTIKRRIAEAGLETCDAVDYARAPDGLALDKNAEHVAALEELLAAGAYDLVIADPLYKLHSGDSNDEREAVDLMRRLDAWRERYGFALILAVHCRKPVPGMKFSIHDLFGSSGYVRGAEVVLGLRRVSDGYSRLHFLKDRDGDLPIGDAWGVLFDREHGFRRDPKDTEERDPVGDLIAFLADAEPSTVPEIARAVGMADKTVRDLLHSSGRFRQTAPPAGRHPTAKVWTLVEAGRPGPETTLDDLGQEALPYGSSGLLEPPKGASSRDDLGRPLVPDPGRDLTDDLDDDEIERLAALARDLESDAGDPGTTEEDHDD